eukprot:4760768-Amphidinium_carterae.3
MLWKSTTHVEPAARPNFASQSVEAWGNASYLNVTKQLQLLRLLQSASGPNPTFCRDIWMVIHGADGCMLIVTGTLSRLSAGS